MVRRYRWRPLAVAGLLWLVLVTSAGPVAGVPFAQETPEQPAVDNTVTRIELAADGSARWTVTVRTRLTTETDVEEYEAFQRRFRADRSRFLDPFRDRITAVVTSAGDATGREMVARSFTAQTRIQEVPRRWGIVEYAFTWDGFAVVDGDAVVMGDTFVGGFFLAADDTLVVVPPDGYEITAVEPTPAERGERAVSWTGREDFAGGQPLVRAVSADAAEADGPGDVIARPRVLAPAVAGLVVLGGLAALAYRRRSTGPATAAQTDEERVLELLDARGGRVQQSAVVEAFGWSTSKTSRLLSRMADDGTIEKLQIGRENLVQLPDDED